MRELHTKRRAKPYLLRPGVISEGVINGFDHEFAARAKDRASDSFNLQFTADRIYIVEDSPYQVGLFRGNSKLPEFVPHRVIMKRIRA